MKSSEKKWWQSMKTDRSRSVGLLHGKKRHFLGGWDDKAWKLTDLDLLVCYNRQLIVIEQIAQLIEQIYNYKAQKCCNRWLIAIEQIAQLIEQIYNYKAQKSSCQPQTVKTMTCFCHVIMSTPLTAFLCTLLVIILHMGYPSYLQCLTNHPNQNKTCSTCKFDQKGVQSTKAPSSCHSRPGLTVSHLFHISNSEEKKNQIPSTKQNIYLHVSLFLTDRSKVQ